VKVGDLVRLGREANPGGFHRAPGRAKPYHDYPPGIVTKVSPARTRNRALVTVRHTSGEELVWGDYELEVINESR